MGLAVGLNSATLGLIFAYDVGDIVNSYIGEPTTNIAYATNNNLNSGANWWINGGNATFNDNDTSIPKPSIPNVDTSNLRIFSSLVTAGGSNQQLGSSIITISPSTTYSFSIWYYFTGTTMAYYPYIRTATNNDSIGVFSYNGNTDGTTWPKNQWILLKATGTTQANETGIYMSSYTGTTVGDKVHYFGYQVEQKGHCTPLVLGTRSATQGLLPLTGSTIDLSNVSFNSSAQMVFDGTNDYINTDFASGYEGTVELIIKCSDYNGDIPFSLDSDNYGSGPNIYFTGNQICWNVGDGNGNPFSNSSYPNSNYHHLVITNQNSGAALYIDGVLIGTAVGRSMVTTGSNKLWLGRYHGGGYYFNGELPVVRLYNRPLNFSEIKDNYRGYKTRFNLA